QASPLSLLDDFAAAALADRAGLMQGAADGVAVRGRPLPGGEFDIDVSGDGAEHFEAGEAVNVGSRAFTPLERTSICQNDRDPGWRILNNPQKFLVGNAVHEVEPKFDHLGALINRGRHVGTEGLDRIGNERGDEVSHAAENIAEYA